jgi:hypothetical protein
MGDFADLFRKEVRLARAEIQSNLSAKLRGGVWLISAGVCGLLALALILGALVAWVATFDVSLHLAFFIVAIGVGVLSVVFFLVGRAEAKAKLAPSRTIEQIKQDIETTKEQLA